MIVRCAATLLIVCLASFAARAGDRVVLLIENRSENRAAPAELRPALTVVLSRKGYEVVAGPEVDKAAAAAGVDHVDSMPAGAADGLLQSFKAQRVVAVTIHFLLDPRQRDLGPRASPAVGLSARGFTADRITWRNSLGVIDDDPGAAAGQKKKPLAQLASTRLLWSFPRGAGASLAKAEQEWDEVTGYEPTEAAARIQDYDVRIERLRAARTGPRFRLKVKPDK